MTVWAFYIVDSDCFAAIWAVLRALISEANRTRWEQQCDDDPNWTEDEAQYKAVAATALFARKRSSNERAQKPPENAEDYYNHDSVSAANDFPISDKNLCSTAEVVNRKRCTTSRDCQAQLASHPHRRTPPSASLKRERQPP